MLVKTSELTGRALDWAVAQCERVEPGRSSGKPYLPEHRVYLEDFIPSYSWAQGGQIIEQEEIGFQKMEGEPVFQAWKGTCIEYACWPEGAFYAEGPTPLVAAMRCLVVARLGDTVEVPEELL